MYPYCQDARILFMRAYEARPCIVFRIIIWEFPQDLNHGVQTWSPISMKIFKVCKTYNSKHFK
jgi:hypothetical protein